jgi:hypothetical protein
MKTILITIALITCINFCYGQVPKIEDLQDQSIVGKDSLPTPTPLSTFVFGDSVAIHTDGNIWQPYQKRESKIDTVLVFILYSDKALANGTVHSMYAYEVLNSYNYCCGGAYGNSFYKVQDHIKYLDHNKKEFPESIVVWLAKKE